jgi:hypothetical protein
MNKGKFLIVLCLLSAIYTFAYSTGNPTIADKRHFVFASNNIYQRYFNIKYKKGNESSNAYYANAIRRPQYSFTDYLPLTVGSSFPLSGTLYGTDTSFSGDLTVSGKIVASYAEFSPSSGYGVLVTAGDQSSARICISNTGTSGKYFYLVAGNPNIDQTGFSIYDGSANATRFRVANSGAVTLGSADGAGTGSLYAGTGNFTQHNVEADKTTTVPNQIQVQGARNTNKQILIGYNTSGNGYGSIQAIFQRTAYTPLILNPVGGNVGIGTTTPSAKLFVEGNISANGVITAPKITVTQLGWSDCVFDKKYKLRSLSSLESFIKQNKHLPEVPSAKEVEENGISVGDNQVLLLKKIEELTLYVIKQQKQINDLKKQIDKK